MMRDATTDQAAGPRLPLHHTCSSWSSRIFRSAQSPLKEERARPTFWGHLDACVFVSYALPWPSAQSWWFLQVSAFAYCQWWMEVHTMFPISSSWMFIPPIRMPGLLHQGTVLPQCLWEIGARIPHGSPNLQMLESLVCNTIVLAYKLQISPYIL